MYKQSYNILYNYLKSTVVSFNKNKLKQLLASHPESNFLFAMIDSLNEMNIENVALNLDMDSLQSNGFPAIAHTSEGGGAFIIVENITDEKVYYYNAKKEHRVKSVNDFAEKWTGVALYAAQNDIQAELERKKRSSGERLLQCRKRFALIIGLIFVALGSVSVGWSGFLFCLLILSVFGLAVSILLTLHDFGESNRIIHKVCHFNRMTNCNAVLKSSAAKLFGWLSMSDIGLCYFTGGYAAYRHGRFPVAGNGFVHIPVHRLFIVVSAIQGEKNMPDVPCRDRRIVG